MARARGATALGIGLLLAAAMTVLLGWSPTLDPVDAIAGRGAIVSVPDLAGLSEPRAVADLEVEGLSPRIERAFSLTVPRGAVISQDPRPGARVREGTDVEVVLSSGISRVEMPDAVGRPLAEVVGPFEDAGVDYLVERVPSEEVDDGVVVEQSPEPGRRVTAQDPVRFVVSTGPEDRPVPDVAGLAPEGAAFALGRAGLSVAEVRLVDDTSRPKGAVVSTEPAAGAVVPRGTAVVVSVSAGPPPVPVPAVVGLGVDEASDALEALGLVPNVVGAGAGGGTVAVQDPPAPTPLRPGSIVRLEVADA
jgi:serine/threonine-protein kinase